MVKALNRYKNGRTGGVRLDKPQMGPIVEGLQDGVPYNYYSPPNELKLLPGPTSAAPMTQEQINLAAKGLEQRLPKVKLPSAAERRSQVPYDYGDVPYNYRGVEPISRDQIGGHFGKEWDALETAQKQAIEDQVNVMWAEQKMPLNEIIKKARQDYNDLVVAKGHKTSALAEALRNAGKK